MPNLFPNGANTLAKLSLILGASAPVVLFYAGSTISRSAANTKVGVPLDQPAFFSHRHHVYELGIDCRYCHPSVEKGAHSGVPATETCMTCHSQVWTNSPLLQKVRDSYANNVPLEWNKVHKLPEFVYFNHSIHIARGINCNTCHGPVSRMMMTYKGVHHSMAWCLECHRDPGKGLAGVKIDAEGLSPRDQVFELYAKQQRGDKMTDAEFTLLNGAQHKPSPAQIAEGNKLVEKYGIKKAQLMDCWICHR